ncbi:MAG TPA: alpha/beta-hydrolase family protein [Jiangellaceae bacterium]
MAKVSSAPKVSGWSDRVVRLARLLNPVVASPSAPLETFASLDALGPSLMPRTSRLQGVGMGLSALAARATSGVAEQLTNVAMPEDASLRRRLTTRALIGASGMVLASLPERDGERLWVASARSAGRLLRAGAAGGGIYDMGVALQQRHPAQQAIRPLAVSVALASGLLGWGVRRMRQTEEAVQRWPLPQTTTLPASLATSAVVTAVGTGLTRTYVWSRGAMESYFGPGRGKRLFARLANAGLWTTGTIALYNAGVAAIGRANERVEPGYSKTPASPLVSGSQSSVVPFSELGQQGRRYVTDVLTPELIQEVMGEPAVAHPIRTYVGFDSEPIYQTGRAELALAELERTGAFDRSYLLLISPTGTGWVDHTVIETAEFLTRGDMATCCVQYGRYPSFLSVQKVALGRGQFRLLLWGIKQRLTERPAEHRPRVLVFGESLGAWTSSDVVMFQGIEGFDHYGIHRALWVGLPWLAKWSRMGMTRGRSTLVPEGTVGVFDRYEQLAALSDNQRDRLRAVVLSHDNDPIAVFGPELLVQRPWWLADGRRGRGVPDAMHWRPLVTFIQTAMDAANAMVSVPGNFGSFGHDYRADMVHFVQEAFRLPSATGEQLSRIDSTLRALELERAERIKAPAPQDAPVPPAHRTDEAAIRAGVPLRVRRTSGARWANRRRSAP